MITSSAARKELNRRKAYSAKPIDLDPSFPYQNAFIEDQSKYIVAQCSRRAGKTNGIAIRFFKTMAKYPKSQCIYLSLTFDSAKDILWPVLQEMNEKYQLGCTFTESKLTMTHPNGAKLKLMGADMKNFIKRLKGRKYPGVGIDEAQDFGTHLESLVNDVLNPSISDYKDGWIALTGTPGPVPQGYFFDITQGKRFGYSVHEWTLFENPYMPEPRLFVSDLLKKREWDENHPTYLREYRNKWVLDVESLWIRYRESLNDYPALPQLKNNQKYNYVVGVDLGYRDSDAIAVLAWHTSIPTTYLVEEVITPKQGITELTNQIETMIKKYNPDKIVMDEGALGKKIGEEMRRQKGIPVEGADKMRKQENVEFLNDALRTGKFKARAISRFATDSYLIQIDWEKSTPDRIIVKKKPHSDIIDAVLYAFKITHAFAFQEEKQKPAYGTAQWQEEERIRMFTEEVERLQRDAEIAAERDDWSNGFG